MSTEIEQEEGALRAKLEFSIGRKSFEKAHTAWTNAPSELKQALLLTGPQLARAETWLVDFPDKLNESEKRFILKSKSTKTLSRSGNAKKSAKGIVATFLSTPVLWAMAIVLVVVARNTLPGIVNRSIERSNAEFAAARGVRSADGSSPAQQQGRSGQGTGGTKTTAEAGTSKIEPPPRSAMEKLDQPNRKWLHAARAMTSEEKVAKLSDMALRRWEIGEERTAMLIATEAVQTSIEAAGPGKTPKGISAAASLFVHKLASRTGATSPLMESLGEPAFFCLPEQRVVVADSASQIVAWNIETAVRRSTIGERPQLFDGASVDAACTHIALTAEEHAVEIISLDTGKRISELTGHEAPVLASAFSPDGTTVATASGDRTVRLWRAADGKRTATLEGHDDRVIAVTYSSDGRLLATGSADATARIWDTASGRELLVLKGHAGAVSAVAFSRDGGRLLTTSRDGTAALWETANGRRTARIGADRGASGSVISATLSPSGREVVTQSDTGEVASWDSATGQARHRLAGNGEPAREVVLSEDGTMVLAMRWNGDAVLWNASLGVEIAHLNKRGQRVVAAAFSSDGRTVRGLTHDGELMTWPVLADASSVVREARAIMPGCLKREERETLGLSTTLPRWCNATAETSLPPPAVTPESAGGQATTSD